MTLKELKQCESGALWDSKEGRTVEAIAVNVPLLVDYIPSAALDSPNSLVGRVEALAKAMNNEHKYRDYVPPINAYVLANTNRKSEHKDDKELFYYTAVQFYHIPIKCEPCRLGHTPFAIGDGGKLVVLPD